MLVYFMISCYYSTASSVATMTILDITYLRISIITSNITYILVTIYFENIIRKHFFPKIVFIERMDELRILISSRLLIY